MNLNPQPLNPGPQTISPYELVTPDSSTLSPNLQPQSSILNSNH